ncbi:Pectin lyase superfamily protein [Heracleum sosnowskyi]|uniref:Pectin lyase superfamily protein n=1 Tax=Heracleum sosnowskyi TaxID=360622 RepID=A0AAD8MPD5_9APIA|nr:Pectin lyase superfamily protein [Heracleum sosnowskyi]
MENKVGIEYKPKIQCGSPHKEEGISIGSIGKNPSDQNVEGVNVQNCKMSSTQNGVRIKTWNSTFQIFVSDVTFQDITMDKAQNPIIIDQQYCGGGHDCTGSSHVQVKDVKFVRVQGKSSSQITVNLNCSRIITCVNKGHGP